MDSGYTRFMSVTKSDTVDIDGGSSTVNAGSVTDALLVNASAAAKTVVLVDRAGNSTTLTFQAAGCFYLPIQVRRVGNSSTAESFIALYR